MQARPRKKRTPVASSDVRRPIRAKNPRPSYKEPVESSHVMRPIHANEEVWLETLEKLKRTCKRKCLQKRVYASEEPRENATERAVKLQSSLEPELPIRAKNPPPSYKEPVESSDVRRPIRPKNPPPSFKQAGLESLEKPKIKALEKLKRTYQRKALQKRVYASKEVGLESPEKPKRTCQRKELPDRVYASAEARKNATERAVKLESSLKPKFSSFVKSMTHSHVTQGFWLGLRFAIDHRLVDGDAVVFHRVEETKFKVYIIRAYGEATNDSNMNDKENVAEINKKEEENVPEASKLQWGGKRKRGGEVSRV